MDRIDVQLLDHLQMNSRITVSELSKELALSRPSISERLHRLQENGIIEEYTARISTAAIGLNILLFIQVSELKKTTEEFEELIRNDANIIEGHRVTGNVSYILKAAVSDMDSMRALIDRLIPFGTIVTSIVLTSPVPYRHLLPKPNKEE